LFHFYFPCVNSQVTLPIENFNRAMAPCTEAIAHSSRKKQDQKSVISCSIQKNYQRFDVVQTSILHHGNSPRGVFARVHLQLLRPSNYIATSVGNYSSSSHSVGGDGVVGVSTPSRSISATSSNTGSASDITAVSLSPYIPRQSVPCAK